MSDDTETDETLMAGVARSHNEALQRLYGRYAPLVYQLALRSLERGSAEDMVQDVFFLLLTKADEFDPKRGTLRNWLLQITHFRILNELRRVNRRPQIVPGSHDLADGPDERYDEPPEETWKTFRRNALQDAVDRLPGPQRQALRLAYFEDLSHSEVADALGIPLGTVKGRIRLALRKLRVGLIAMGLVIVGLWGLGATLVAWSASQSSVQDETTISLLTRPDVEVKRLSAPERGVSGTCTYTTLDRSVVVSLRGLAHPGPDQVYRFWARWDDQWTMLGDLVARGDRWQLVQSFVQKWQKEPSAIAVSLESRSRLSGPMGSVVVESKL